jgi:hypothetical protein
VILNADDGLTQDERNRLVDWVKPKLTVAAARKGLRKVDYRVFGQMVTAMDLTKLAERSALAFLLSCSNVLGTVLLWDGEGPGVLS